MSLALKKRIGLSLVGLLSLGAASACSADDDPGMNGPQGGTPSSSGTGGAMAGSASGGVSAQAGTGGGGVPAAGGGGATSAGSGAGGSSAGSVATGGSAGSGGGATGGVGGASGGSGGAAGGGSGGSGAFDPCPATGDCKVLPLGDSITFGTPSNNGGYRVKLFINAKTDNKKMTIVAGKVVSGSGGSTGPSGPSAAPNGPTMVMVNGMNVPFPRENEGYPGITVGDLDKRRCANGDGFTNMPHIVLLHIGTNDMYGGDPAGAPDRLSKIIDSIATAAPNALIAVASLIPLTSGMSQVMTYNSKVPGIVQMKAAAGKHVIFVDQFKDFPTSELADGVHPDESKGYPRMGDVWYTAIKQYLH